MSTAASRPMALEAFLDWERAQELAYEFDGTGPVAMTGGSIRHRRIARDLTQFLNERLLSRGCEAFAGDVKVVSAERVRYPDVVVSCAAQDGASDIVRDPVLVVEVLSPSTARTDRILKLEEYRGTPSIQDYIVLEQEVAEGILLARRDDQWIATRSSRRPRSRCRISA